MKKRKHIEIKWLGAILFFLFSCNHPCPPSGLQAQSTKVQAIINGTVQSSSPLVVWIWDDPHQNNEIRVCTGVLVSNDWVLTAGHCINDPVPGHYTIYWGSDLKPLLSQNDPSADTQIRLADHLLPHPLYQPNDAVHSIDVALIHVNIPFVINQSSTGYLIDIYDGTADDLVGKPMTLFGYGCYAATSATDNSTDGNLRDAQLVSISNTDHHLLFQENSLLQSSCFGDSGGPVFLAGTSTLAAINHAGNIQQGTSLSVASDAFRPWVVEQIGTPSNSLAPGDTPDSTCE